MNKSNLNLYCDPDEAPVLSPGECIAAMFALTDENGVLYIPAWTYDDDPPEDQARFYRCRMDWTEADRDDALRLYENCYEIVRELAPQYDSIRAGGADALSEAQRAFWNTYLRGFASDNPDAVRAEAQARVGESPAACDVIVRARRLFRLTSLEAPEIIVRSEANLFAQALVIHRFCRELEIADGLE